MSSEPARRTSPLLVLAAIAVVAAACTAFPAAASDPTRSPGPSADAAPAGSPGAGGAEPAAPTDPGTGGGSSGNAGSGKTADPDQPVSGTPGPPDAVPEPSALAVKPRAGLQNVRPQAWDRVALTPDGKTLTVYFWSGVEECYGLDRVDVDRTGDTPKVTLYTGTRPGVEVCIEIAVYKSTTVKLDEPLVLDGSER